MYVPRQIEGWKLCWKFYEVAWEIEEGRQAEGSCSAIFGMDSKVGWNDKDQKGEDGKGWDWQRFADASGYGEDDSIHSKPRHLIQNQQAL